MPNTLTEKAIAQPLRVGLMLGALALPSFWVASQDVLKILMGDPILNSEQVTQLFAAGFVPGMILGAGALRAWTQWRVRNAGSARRLLIAHGLFALLPCGGFLPPLFTSQSGLLAEAPDGWAMPLGMWAFLFYDLFPVQIALAMFLVGLFMRGKDA